MGGLSPIHWIIIIVLLLLIFGGGGKLSGLMGDAAKGVKAFKDGLKDEGEGKSDAPRTAEPEKLASDAKPEAESKPKTEANAKG
jgi:sec-independent protein translocase protein TatA